MRLLVAPDSTFYKTPDGKYWSQTVYPYHFFERYLSVFDSIIVASRVKIAAYADVENFMRADGPNMTVIELPSINGITGYIRQFFNVCRTVKKAVSGAAFDCSVIRLPSVPASFVYHYVRKLHKPLALEVVADPEYAYADNRIAQSVFVRHLKKSALSANGVSYVTKDYLQQRYPAYCRIHGEDDKHFESFFSTIQLDDSYYGQPKRYVGKKSFNIIHTANNVNNDVKGHAVLIRAFKLLIDKGYDLYLTFVGDGRKKPEFENLTAELGLSSRVRFTGKLIGSIPVREELLKADMLVFPTKAEGLPRTVIEAMAVGLPCISTPVAGIPELLEKEDMFDPTDVKAFAKRIEYFISYPEIMEEKSARNIRVALDYRNDILTERRNLFYSKLKEIVRI